MDTLSDWMSNVSWLMERRASLLRRIAEEDDDWRTPVDATTKRARRNALDIIEGRLRELRAAHVR